MRHIDRIAQAKHQPREEKHVGPVIARVCRQGVDLIPASLADAWHLTPNQRAQKRKQEVAGYASNHEQSHRPYKSFGALAVLIPTRLPKQVLPEFVAGKPEQEHQQVVKSGTHVIELFAVRGKCADRMISEQRARIGERESERTTGALPFARERSAP